MITVAIVGILAAISYPIYQDYVEGTRRAAAQADLLELAQWMERRYSTNFAYQDDDGSDPTLPFDTSPRNGTATAYDISFDGDVEDDTFTLQAVPTSLQDSDRCGTLTLAHTGARGATKSGAAVTDCW